MIQLSIMERLRRIKTEPTLKDRANSLLAHYLVTSDNIGYAVAPLVGHIHKEKPNYILAFDRGARIVGLATAMLHHEMYGPLPTLDKKIHFRKVSVSADPEQLKSYLGPLVNLMLDQVDNPKLLVLDDWIHGGETKAVATDLIAELSDGKVDLTYGVLIGDDIGKGFGKGKGNGADVWGVANNFAYYSWRNNEKVTGVDYDSNLQVRKTLAPKATVFRRHVAQSIKRYAQQHKNTL